MQLSRLIDIVQSLSIWISWQQAPRQTEPQSRTFHLRHLHAIDDHSRNVFADVNPLQSFSPITFDISSQRTTVHKQLSTNISSRWHSQWQEEEMAGPNVKSRKTLLNLAKMSSNSFFENPAQKGWYELCPEWNKNRPFGWEPEADGLRGQIFVSDDESVVIVAIKGTSAPWVAGGDGPTKENDKLNNNMLFSCCCARVGPSWKPVCDCYAGDNKCDVNCVQAANARDSLFYSAGANLYNNVSYMYPNAAIWLTGHSLGGSLASLIGVTFGVPVVSFESPGDKLAAERLHLPSPPQLQHITHVYHTADPVAMGSCNGFWSTCAAAGYALETRCHLGKIIRYDTTGRWGWYVNIRNHGIQVVIDNILNEDWDPENGLEVPEVGTEVDCIECTDWEFGDFPKPACTPA